MKAVGGMCMNVEGMLEIRCVCGRAVICVSALVVFPMSTPLILPCCRLCQDYRIETTAVGLPDRVERDPS